jgi:hypothetical protein
MPLPTETSIMTKLSDTQAVLLSTAAQRATGSLLPLPASLKPGGGATKALEALAKRSFAEERETSDVAARCRSEGDLSFGLFLTGAGAAAIGVTLPGGEQQETASDEAPQAPTSAKAPRKAALVLDLLSRPAGATLAELMELTGWLPHTTRAALTGLRKKGHAISRGKRDGVTCYTAGAQ